MAGEAERLRKLSVAELRALARKAGLDAAGDDFAPYRALLAAVQGRLCADFGVAPAPAAHRPEAARLPVLHEVLP